MVAPGESSSGEDRSDPSEKIIEAVAEHEGIETTAVEPPTYAPLYDVINPEALDALFRGPKRNPGTVEGRVEFRYGDYWVTVHSDGSVEVEPAESGEEKPTGVDDGK